MVLGHFGPLKEVWPTLERGHGRTHQVSHSHMEVYSILLSRQAGYLIYLYLPDPTMSVVSQTFNYY